MIKTLASDTIGTGPALQITDPEIVQDESAAIEELFWQWCKATKFASKLRLMRSSKARDGESFAIITNNPRSKTPVRLDMKVMEADQFASPSVEFRDRGRNLLTDGIIYDDWGNVVGYTVLKEHPGESIFHISNDVEFFPASQVIHLYDENRAGAGRGIPEITPGLPLYAQLRRYTLAVIRAAESAALPSWVMESMMNPQQEAVAADPFDTVETERGMGMVMPYGWKMSQIKAEQPTSTYPQFKAEIIGEIARCLCMPYNVAAGNSSGYNYSSGRLDHRTYYKSLRVERALFEDLCVDVMFVLWWEEASRIRGYLPDRFYRTPTPLHRWIWDGDEHVDPTKEADAAATRIATGLSTPYDECATLGKDGAEVQAKLADYFGVSVEELRKLQLQATFGASQQPAAAVEQPQDTETDDEED